MEYKNNQAIYLQIADNFLENILQKKWNQGDKIPSIKDVAIEYEVNPHTTMRTFSYLQEKGILSNKRGIGYYIAEDGFDKTLALKRDRFILEELPAFFKTMRLLGISIENLNTFYAEADQTAQ